MRRMVDTGMMTLLAAVAMAGGVYRMPERASYRPKPRNVDDSIERINAAEEKRARRAARNRELME